MNPFRSQRPEPQEHEALMHELGPLPVRGKAWPTWVKVLTWLVLIVIGSQIIRVATGPQGHSVNPVIAGCIIICFCALILVARFMVISETTISREGIEQTWITRRRVTWEEIQFAKFIPMIASKRLVCFTGSGRPLVFQAGTRELQIAFARISLVYTRRQ